MNRPTRIAGWRPVDTVAFVALVALLSVAVSITAGVVFTRMLDTPGAVHLETVDDISARPGVRELPAGAIADRYAAWQATSTTTTTTTEPPVEVHAVGVYVHTAPLPDIQNRICEAFGDRCAQALAVARCESRFDPTDVGAAGERGLFQIHPVHAEPGELLDQIGLSWDAMFDVDANIAAARALFLRDGWTPWSCA